VEKTAPTQPRGDPSGQTALDLAPGTRGDGLLGLMLLHEIAPRCQNSGDGDLNPY